MTARRTARTVSRRAALAAGAGALFALSAPSYAQREPSVLRVGPVGIEPTEGPRLGPSYDTKTDYGAKGDGQEATAILSIAAGTKNLSSTTNLWTSGDVGKQIFVEGAGPLLNGLPVLSSTIVTVTNAKNIILNDNATASLVAASKIVTWGTDDTAAFQAFLTANQGLSGVNLTIPVSTGFYCLFAAQQVHLGG